MFHVILKIVVYLLIPTSNHNVQPDAPYEYIVVYLLIPTSNHNLSDWLIRERLVVYLLIPTSNHNAKLSSVSRHRLYIF